jgi:uncharacterized protein YdhG (YjbR/CyaY superfamily)
VTSAVGAVDDYFAGLDASTRAVFEHVRDVALAAAPDAEQGKSYGMAALLLRKKPLLGFLATKQHLSVFPFSPAVVEGVRDQLSGFEMSKGTIRFTVAKPLPDPVVREVVRLRVAEIAGTNPG